MLEMHHSIKSIVFDLDGTLYQADSLGREIADAADIAVASSRGTTLAEGHEIIVKARERLTETLHEEPTLSLTCMELGLELSDLHRYFEKEVHPERHVVEDPVLGALLDSLSAVCDLYIYTNNNRFLTNRIMRLLGVGRQFRKIYTIEFCWQPKPDRGAFRRVLEDIGGPPESFLVVGDRQQVDLQPAEEMGIQTLLVNDTADLLQIHRLMGIVP